jgi:hypothetical protein
MKRMWKTCGGLTPPRRRGAEAAKTRTETPPPTGRGRRTQSARAARADCPGRSPKSDWIKDSLHSRAMSKTSEARSPDSWRTFSARLNGRLSSDAENAWLSRRPKRRKSQASRQREQWASKGEDLCQALGCSLVELLRWPGMAEFQCYHSPGAHSWKDFLARIMTEANAKSSRQQSSRKFRKADECLPESAKANGCIRLSTIWGRGWSKGQVEAILGEADARTRNPHYRKAAQMRLYSTARVLQAEKEGRVLLRPRITKITPVS